MIVIGLGSGRSGTASLAKLLNAQKDSLCFHEMNPSCVRFRGTPRPIVNGIDEYQSIVDGGDPSSLTVDLSREVAAKAYDQLCKMQKVRMIGDIAFYYLTYVDLVVERNSNVRFICLRRKRTETIDSWERKLSVNRWPSKYVADRLGTLITREPFFKEYNPLMEHDGSQWAVDPVWDKCFPKFPGPTRREAIEQYYDYYYSEADKLQEKYSDVFWIVETETINTKSMQEKLLDYCGVPLGDQVYTDAHIHKSRM